MVFDTDKETKKKKKVNQDVRITRPGDFEFREELGW